MKAKRNTTAKFLKSVSQTIEEHQLFQKEDRLLVALSGGADSVALLLSLQLLGYSIEALHCNFHLRGEESYRDETFVRELCKEKDIKLYVKDFDTSSYAKDRKVSIEMAARDLRYEWFEKMRIERNASVICVAHHQQDQAETLLLNLLRGTGLRGLCGMHYKNVHIARPLLDSSKENIILFLNEQHQNWVEDSTNKEREALRNRIRLDVLPMLKSINPQAIPHLAESAMHLQSALKIYDNEVEQQHLQNCRLKNKDRHIPLSDTQILHELLSGCGFNSTQEDDIMHAHVGAIIESTTHRLLRDRQDYVLESKENPPHSAMIDIDVIDREKLKQFEPGMSYFDYQQVPLPYNIRPAQKGDRMTPFGMNGSRLVSDILTDLKYNAFEKERQQVVLDDKGNILCIAGVRSSNLYPITEQTRRVLAIG